MISSLNANDDVEFIRSYATVAKGFWNSIGRLTLPVTLRGNPSITDQAVAHYNKDSCTISQEHSFVSIWSVHIIISGFREMRKYSNAHSS